MTRISIAFVVAATVAATAAARADAPAVKSLSAKELPRGVKAPKGLGKALSWTDANGAGVLMFSYTDHYDDDIKSAYLQVDLVAVKGGKARTLRTVKDKVEQCGEDMTAEFIDAATAVTDLDGDGAAEVTFAYRVSCKGDVSPDTIKVLVLENGDKYILRGDDTFELEPGKRQGGTFTPEPAAAKWPPAFLDQAKQTWAAIVKR